MATLLTTQAIYAAVLILGVTAAAHAQLPANAAHQAAEATPQAIDQTQPLMLLSEAKQALDIVPDTPGDLRALADLRRDFTVLQAMYLAQSANPAHAGVGGSSRTGITTGASTGAVGTSGVPGSQPVGTSGSQRSTAAADWRTQYALVMSDIAAVAATTPSGNEPTRRDALRTSLEDLQSRLEKFFTSTLGPTASSPAATRAPLLPLSQAVTPSTPAAETRVNGEALVLLQRMEALLNRSTDDNGHSLKEAGLVKMERADVDEIKAEIAELKAMLRR